LKHDAYIEYDGIGIVEIRCMVCLETVISSRAIVEINGKTAVVQKKNASYNVKEIEVLKNGHITKVGVMCCNECKNKEMDDEHITTQARIGITREYKAHGYDQEHIDKVLKVNYNWKSKKEKGGNK